MRAVPTRVRCTSIHTYQAIYYLQPWATELCSSSVASIASTSMARRSSLLVIVVLCLTGSFAGRKTARLALFAIGSVRGFTGDNLDFWRYYPFMCTETCQLRYDTHIGVTAMLNARRVRRGTLESTG